jgi:hypothetical protein
MATDHRKRDDRLFSIKDVAENMRVSERTLRDVIADLGFRRPPGRKRYLFDAAQVAAIKDALKCRSTLPPGYGMWAGASSPIAASTVASTRAERTRLSKLAGQRVRARLWPTGGR